MNCRTVTDNEGNHFQLTPEEEKYLRAIERLEKMDSGRLELFANGRLSVRIDGCWYGSEFMGTSIRCDGGDGGDR